MDGATSMVVTKKLVDLSLEAEAVRLEINERLAEYGYELPPIRQIAKVDCRPESSGWPARSYP